MNALIKKNEVLQTSHNFKSSWKELGAFGGILFGLILMLAGIGLSLFAFIEKVNYDKAELIMLVTAFVLLGLGAHCLDLIEKEKKDKRRQP